MPRFSEYPPRRGTIHATFGQNGTISTAVCVASMRVVGMYAPVWPGGAGSVTFNASLDGSGTGAPLVDQAGNPFKVNPFGSGSYYSFQSGTVPHSAIFLHLQVGTAGTPGVAAGGTIVIIGELP